MSNSLLVIAGVGGMLIAVAHGLIGQKRIVGSIEGLPSTLKRLNCAVFQLSTAYWFCGGLALALVPFFSVEPGTQSTLAVVVAFVYFCGAAANFWATRGRHFGWPALVAVAALALFAA